MPKLIVIRGNSGSGKSVVAQRLRETTSRKVAWVEQDAIRRKMLKEKDVDSDTNIAPAMIAHIVEFALARGYDVILEGILGFSRYGDMLKKLAQLYPENYFFYFDVSLDETLRRHSTKPNAHEFGREEMERWYRGGDVTGFPKEIVISEHLTIDDAVGLITQTTGLS